MSKTRDLQVPAREGPLSALSPAELRMLDRGLDSVDSMSEAESGMRASIATLNAGQAAVRALGALRGRR